MTFSSSLAFFDHLMNEGDLDEAAFVAFLQARTSDEGLHLDFKSGLELDKPKDKRNFTVKQYVGAFANSEGGVLVIGVKDQTTDEKRRRQPKVLAPITPQQETGVGGDLARWAKDCVADLIGYLGVPPRLKVIDVIGGKVLLVAVPRAPSLVPVIKEGRQAYYFRVEDEAREVYPHLVSDLVLGRRQSPELHPRLKGWRVATGHHTSVTRRDGGESTQGSVCLTFGGSLTFTNDSLVTANEIAAGLIGFSLKARDSDVEPSMPDGLRSRIALVPHPVDTSHPYALHHKRLTFRAAQPGERERSSHTIRPFGTAPADVGFQWVVESRPPRRHEFLLALYIVPEGCEPLWFEIGLLLYAEASNRMENKILDDTARIVRVIGRRPRVGLVVAQDEAS